MVGGSSPSTPATFPVYINAKQVPTMRDFLTEYQMATLQVMGISVWTSAVDNSPEKSIHTSAAKVHSEQWKTDNAGFIADVCIAISYLRPQTLAEKPQTLEWFESGSEAFSVIENGIFAPYNLAEVSAAQKQQLWQAIQQSCKHDN